MFENILILSPHPDDETLGVGGLLTSEQVLQAHVRYFNCVHPAVDYKVYFQENIAVVQAGNFETSMSPLVGVNKLDRYPIAELVDDIEKTINTVKPKTLLIPHPSYNQDHRVIFAAALTAARIHDTNFIVPNILTYEQPETHTPSFEEFVPHVFTPIDITKKLNLFRLYQSQQRGHRSDEHLRAMAVMRGMQCGFPFAEAFHIVRMIKCDTGF